MLSCILLQRGAPHPWPQEMAPWFAALPLFCWMQSTHRAQEDAGALWDCLLTVRILGLVEAWLSASTHFSFPQT